MVNARLFDRIRDIITPIEVQQDLSDRAKDSRAAGTSEREVYTVRVERRERKGMIHDEGSRRRKRSFSCSRVVEGRSCSIGIFESVLRIHGTNKER